MEDENAIKLNAYIDFYDYEQVEKLHLAVKKKYVQLIKKLRQARNKGDEKAIKKALEALRKHLAHEEKLKEKAEKAYFYWY
jgi:hypothetical protein